MFNDKSLTYWAYNQEFTCVLGFVKTSSILHSETGYLLALKGDMSMEK